MVCLIILSLISVNVFARSSVPREQLGIALLPEIIYPSGKAADGYSPEYTYGFGAELSYSYPITSFFGLMGGIDYSKKVISYTWSKFGYNEKTTLYANYIDMNLAARFVYGSWYGLTGAYYGIKIGDARRKSTGDLGDSSVTVNSFNGGKTNDDIGIMLGAGYAYPVNARVNINAGIRSKIGLSYIYEDDVVKINNCSLQISVGADFAFGN